MDKVLTPEQTTKLAEYFHARDCSLSHMDQCSWEHEKDPIHQGEQWTHKHWESRVPELMASDRARVAETDELLDTLFGGWLVFGYDYNAIPLALCKTRSDANQFVADLGYPAWVKFWEFGTTWDFLNLNREIGRG